MAHKLEIVRCTNETIRIDITDADGKPYSVVSGEAVIFGVKRKPTDDHLILTKIAKVDGAGSYLVEIKPDDTEALTCEKYWYDVSLQSGDNFYNVIEASPLVILPNITKRGCAQ